MSLTSHLSEASKEDVLLGKVLPLMEVLRGKPGLCSMLPIMMKAGLCGMLPIMMKAGLCSMLPIMMKAMRLIRVHQGLIRVHQGFECRVSGIVCIVWRLSCILHPVSCILYPVSCILYPASCTLYPASCTVYRVSCIMPDLGLVRRAGCGLGVLCIGASCGVRRVAQVVCHACEGHSLMAVTTVRASAGP